MLVMRSCGPAVLQSCGHAVVPASQNRQNSRTGNGILLLLEDQVKHEQYDYCTYSSG